MCRLECVDDGLYPRMWPLCVEQGRARPQVGAAIFVLSALWHHPSRRRSAGDAANAPSPGGGRARPGGVCHALISGVRAKVLSIRTDSAAISPFPTLPYTLPPIVYISRSRPEDSGVSGREATTLKGKEGAGQAWHHWREMRPLYGLI